MKKPLTILSILLLAAAILLHACGGLEKQAEWRWCEIISITPPGKNDAIHWEIVWRTERGKPRVELRDDTLGCRYHVGDRKLTLDDN